MLYHELIRVIAEKYPDVHYDNLGYVFPPYVPFFVGCVQELSAGRWKDIDWEHPERTFSK